MNHVKKAVAESLWSVCSECLKERRFCDGQPVLPADVWLCLKCGLQVRKIFICMSSVTFKMPCVNWTWLDIGLKIDSLHI